MACGCRKAVGRALNTAIRVAQAAKPKAPPPSTREIRKPTPEVQAPIEAEREPVHTRLRRLIQKSR